MKGIVAGKPGQVEKIDFQDPVVGDGDIVLTTLACGVCATDLKTVQKGSAHADFAIGHEIIGRITEIGKNVKWKVGQRVAVAPYLPCGACIYCRNGQETLCKQLFEVYPSPGGMAEKVYVPADLVKRGLIPIPDDLPDAIASLAEPLGCVVKGIEDAHVLPGNSVLVIGDGPMGVMAAACARAYGAAPVIIAGMTAHRLTSAKESFADITIDVSQVDLAAEVKKLTDGQGADVVIVAVSTGETLQTGIRCVRPGGTVNAFAGTPDGTTIPLDVRALHYQQIHLTGSFGTTPEYMAKAIKLLQYHKVAGEAIVTMSFPFTEINAAIDYAMERRGLKAVVTF